MSKDLYREALADAKKVREIATRDAEHAVLEALAPRIKSLIEEQLMNEGTPPDPEYTPERRTPPPAGDAANQPQPVQGEPIAVIDMGQVPEEIEEPVAEVGIDAASEELPAGVVPDDLGVQIQCCAKDIEQIRSMTKAGFGATRMFENKIAKTIAGVENTYDYVQEVVSDPALKTKLEHSLENQYRYLKQIREDAMKNRNRKLTEADDLGLDADASAGGGDEGGDLDIGGDEGAEGGAKKVNLDISFNAPEDFDVDALQDLEVSVHEGDEDEDAEGGEEDMGAEGDDAGGDLGDLGDLGGGDKKMESLSRMSDDTIIELDEAMLRRELQRMRRLSETGFPTPSVDGYGVDDAAMDDFGGGSEEGDPLEDVETEDTQSEGTTRSKTRSRRATNESRRMIAEEADVVNEDEAEEDKEKPEVTEESLTKRLAYEARIQKAAQSRGTQLKREGIKARSAGNAKRYNALRQAYVAESRRFNESVQRSQKIKARLNEAARSTRSNSRAPQADVLRRKLAESNLDNVKLQYANQLLQMSNISNEKKLQIVEQLDTVQSPREAKLVFESATKLVGSAAPQTARHAGAGSASRPTRSGGATPMLNEGFEVNRWAHLAGIK